MSNYIRLLEVLHVEEQAGPLVESLKETGQLPPNYVTKARAMAMKWSPGKTVNNFIPGGQIGGDVFTNKTGVVPSEPGRIWYEADVGLTNTMSRSNQPGWRLVYSNDGLLYVTTDHYEVVHFLGTWK